MQQRINKSTQDCTSEVDLQVVGWCEDVELPLLTPYVAQACNSSCALHQDQALQFEVT